MTKLYTFSLLGVCENGREMLRDDQWKHIEPLCSGKASKREVTGRDNRRFADAVLWIARTGSPWRVVI